MRTNSPITIDGRLDEQDWQRAEVAKDFTQRDPDEGKPAREKTEVRILYDEEMLYIGAICFDSRPDLVIAHNYRRDGSFLTGDYFGLFLDTFGDSQHGFGFGSNPAGAQYDWQFAGEGMTANEYWDGVWFVATSRDERGWIAEFGIPFRTLRFKPGDGRPWKINFERHHPRNVERSFWSPIPRQFIGEKMSLAGELLGVRVDNPGYNMKVKPFAAGEYGDIKLRSQLERKVTGGIDVKYSLTPALTLDLAVNPDFSHVDVDDQQVNLTRFPLFFPDKREFFLENSHIFQLIPSGFGGDVRPFFSRRIGLSDAGRPVQVVGGGRLSGKLDQLTNVGFIYARTDELENDPISQETVPESDFLVWRVRREFAAGGSIGTIAVARRRSNTWQGIAGADGELTLLDYGRLAGYWLKSYRTRILGKDQARYLEAGWRAPNLQFTLSGLDLQENFRADAGFIPRPSTRKYHSSLRVPVRPMWNWLPWVNEIVPGGWIQYYEDQTGSMETVNQNATFDIIFREASRIELILRKQREQINRPFNVPGNLLIQPGDYSFVSWSAQLRASPAYQFRPSVRLEGGEFWDGTISTIVFDFSWTQSATLSVAGSYRRDQIDLPRGNATVDLPSMRISFAASPNLFSDLTFQYNSVLKQLLINARLDFIHRPLSHLYLTFNEARNVELGQAVYRTVTVKFSYLFSL